MTASFFLRSLALTCLVFVDLRTSVAFAADQDRAKQVTSAMLPITTGTNMRTSLDFGIYRTSSDSVARKLSAYETDASGQWILPDVIAESGKHHVPLVLRTPHGNIRIKIKVLVDGFSPEQTTEKLLDDVIGRAGTEDSVVVIPEQSDDPGVESAEERSAEAEEATVAAMAFRRDSVLTKLERLVRATGAEAADREELHWMLDQWRPGPLWLIARDSVSPPRRPVEPWVAWMDSDRDGMLQQNEWEGLSLRIKRLDSNRDRIVTLSELEENAAKTSRSHRSSAPQNRWNLAWEGSASSHSDTRKTEFLSTMEILVQIRSSGFIDQVASVVDQFLSSKLSKSLGSQISMHDESGLVSAIPNGIQATIKADAAIPAIRMTVHGYVNRNLASVASCQFSIAAKVAERPIWNVIDTNGDGRLVEVEQRNASDRIAELDLNKDGAVSAQEWPLAYHIIVCQGNDAAEQLKTIRTRVLIPERKTPPAAIPDWFNGMDSNQDGSLTRGEFLGSTIQFKGYDQNSDQLLTPSEITTTKTNSIDSP